jgi:hypothetical protein
VRRRRTFSAGSEQPIALGNAYCEGPEVETGWFSRFLEDTNNPAGPAVFDSIMEGGRAVYKANYHNERVIRPQSRALLILRGLILPPDSN